MVPTIGARLAPESELFSPRCDEQHADGDDGDHPWRIGIKDPREPDQTIGWFEASNTTVHTSGDYERFIMVNGKRYHHVLDPENGYPASRSRSVTVITPDGTLGDALSTGIFVLGPTKGLRLVESLTDVEALIIDATGSVHMSTAMHKVVHLVGDDAK